MLTAEDSHSSLEYWLRPFSGWIGPADANRIYVLYWEVCVTTDSTANAPGTQHQHVTCMLNQRNSLVRRSRQVPEVPASVHTLIFLGPPRTSTAAALLSEAICKHLLECMTSLTLHESFTKVVFPDDLILLTDPRCLGNCHSQIASDLIGHPLRVCNAKTYNSCTVEFAGCVISANFELHLHCVRCRLSMFPSQTECKAVVSRCSELLLCTTEYCISLS